MRTFHNLMAIFGGFTLGLIIGSYLKVVFLSL